jgi:hypothetical protein
MFEGFLMSGDHFTSLASNVYFCIAMRFLFPAVKGHTDTHMHELTQEIKVNKIALYNGRVDRERREFLINYH